MTYLWSVFTKPWLALPGHEVGRLVSGLGFAGAEVPVREAAYVIPATAEAELPKFVRRYDAAAATQASNRSALPVTCPSGCSPHVRRPACR